MGPTRACSPNCSLCSITSQVPWDTANVRCASREIRKEAKTAHDAMIYRYCVWRTLVQSGLLSACGVRVHHRNPSVAAMTKYTENSKAFSQKARDVVLGIRSVTVGVPGIEDGEPLTFRTAAEHFPATSSSALQRMVMDPKLSTAVDGIKSLQLPEDLNGFDMDIMARSLYCLLPQHGAKTALDPFEEFMIVENALELQDKGFSLEMSMLDGWALAIARVNHVNSPTHMRWERNGVSADWRKGFLKRWGHILAKRFGEGMCGGRRQVTKAQCTKLYEILQELGEEYGANTGEDGKKRFASFQMGNLDETNCRMTNKNSPTLGMKGTPKALRAEHNKYRDSLTMLLMIFADGVVRVPPFIIVNGAEGDEGTFNQPSWWGMRDVVQMLKGTMMQQSPIAQQKNAYMTNSLFYPWVKDCLIPALGMIAMISIVPVIYLLLCGTCVHCI